MPKCVRLETIAVNATQLKRIHALALRRAKKAKAPLKLYFRRVKGHVPSTTATGTSCKNHSLIEVPPDIRRHVIKHKSKGRVKLKGALGRAHSRGVACYADADVDMEDDTRVPSAVPTPTLQPIRLQYAPYAVEGKNPGLGSEAADAAREARWGDMVHGIAPPPGYYSRWDRMGRILALRRAKNELIPRVNAAGRTHRGNLNLAIQLEDIKEELEKELWEYDTTAPFEPAQQHINGMGIP
jgi:hypothetical protein